MRDAEWDVVGARVGVRVCSNPSNCSVSMPVPCQSIPLHTSTCNLCPLFICTRVGAPDYPHPPLFIRAKGDLRGFASSTRHWDCTRKTCEQPRNQIRDRSDQRPLRSDAAQIRYHSVSVVTRGRNGIAILFSCDLARSLNYRTNRQIELGIGGCRNVMLPVIYKMIWGVEIRAANSAAHDKMAGACTPRPTDKEAAAQRDNNGKHDIQGKRTVDAMTAAISKQRETCRPTNEAGRKRLVWTGNQQQVP